MDPVAAMWDELAVRAVARADKHNYLSHLPKVCVPEPSPAEDPLADIETFDGPGPWDRTLLDVEVENPLALADGEPPRKKVIIFSGNDYLNLSSHPAVRKASAKAHTTLVCGKNGGGIAEVHGVEDHVDISVGTLSKATGCLGGFIACNKKWERLIRGRGRPYIFTTACPLPVVVACYAAVTVAKKEEWRRQAVWSRVREFSALTKYPASSPIISLVVGTEAAALKASKHMLECGFHVTAILPTAVAPNACRLRVTLTAAHTTEDIAKLVAALSHCIPALQEGASDHQVSAKL